MFLGLFVISMVTGILGGHHNIVNIGHATYIGKCEKDGFYYNDENSFVMCSNGNGYMQPCAPGTRNSGSVTNGDSKEFCDVNLVDYGYTAKITSKKKHQRHGVKTLEGYIHGNEYHLHNNGYGKGNPHGQSAHGGYDDGNHGYKPYQPHHEADRGYDHHEGYKVKKLEKHSYKTYSQKKYVDPTNYHPDPYNPYEKPEGYVAEKHYHNEYEMGDPYHQMYNDYGHHGYGYKKKGYGGYGKKRHGYKKKSYGYKKKSYGYKKKGYGGHRGYGSHGGHRGYGGYGGGYGKKRSHGYGYH